MTQSYHLFGGVSYVKVLRNANNNGGLQNLD